ncbi:unnamed protein product [Vitrella brassicaformis CCMP3155]|uniref:Roadblock/LAMTOR2 domain-containing protein n=2 Tax=Vitrella brassicaformis TaxID=1169539 RepID=A0A0G4EQY2_VITBC|nr:unnamed protein product [Vitrella brassicaformis CCMP3155]|eukprot:CEM00653.1 unnamed protein product [Vitrella brassicaformis CCMP3155]
MASSRASQPAMVIDTTSGKILRRDGKFDGDAEAVAAAVGKVVRNTGRMINKAEALHRVTVTFENAEYVILPISKDETRVFKKA